MNNLILKNVHLLDPSENLDSLSDILISDGKIKKISNEIKRMYRDEEICHCSTM